MPHTCTPASICLAIAAIGTLPSSKPPQASTIFPLNAKLRHPPLSYGIRYRYSVFSLLILSLTHLDNSCPPTFPPILVLSGPCAPERLQCASHYRNQGSD